MADYPNDTANQQGTSDSAHQDSPTANQALSTTEGGLSVLQVNREEMPDQALVERAVREINELANKMVYKGSIDVGEYLLREFFNNDPKLAASKNPSKKASYRELCKREDLTIKAPQLSVMVRVAAQERFFLENEIDSDKLSYRAKAELIKLPSEKPEEKAAKIAVIGEIIAGGMTTRQVAEKILQIRHTDESGPGTVGGKLPVKYFDALDRYFEDEALARLSVGEESLRKVRKDTRLALKEKALATKDKIQHLIAKCDALVSAIEKIESEEREKPKKQRGKGRGKK